MDLVTLVLLIAAATQVLCIVSLGIYAWHTEADY